MTFGSHRSLRQNSYLSLLSLESQEFIKERFYSDTLQQKRNDTEQCLINIHPEVKLEKFEGFGAALTEATAASWMKLGDSKKEKLVRLFFCR